jgi:D-xylose transport system substrate-binding protein
MTVFKDTKKEAAAASDLAIALAKRLPKPAPTTVKDSESGSRVPAVLLQPQAIYRDNVKDVVDAGYVSAKDLCVGRYAAMCDEAGIR